MDSLIKFSPEFLVFAMITWGLMVGAGMLARKNVLQAPRVIFKHLGNITLILMLLGYYLAGFSGAVQVACVLGIGAYVFLAVALKRIFPFDDL